MQKEITSSKGEITKLKKKMKNDNKKKLLYMSDFHSEYATCMELLKPKSKDISETDILLKAKKLVHQIARRGRKGRDTKKEKEMPVLRLYSFTLLSSIIVLMIINNIIDKYY